MSKTALLFPGQGAQFVTMAKDLHDEFEVVRELFARANDTLGFDIAKICFEGPEAELNRTDVSQPAIYLHSFATTLVLESLGKMPEFDFAAGLSLGEYTALAVAGVFDFEAGLDLVHARGKFMQEACDLAPSGMTTIVGLNADQAREVADAARQNDVLTVANYLGDAQFALSGSKAAIARAETLARENGAKMVVPLAVAGAFHSALMAPAKEKLAEKIESTEFRAPSCGIVCNVDANVTDDPQALKRNLVEQLTGAVRWHESTLTLQKEGVAKYIEIGPGKTLTNLVKRVDRNASRVNLGTTKEVSSN
ncbi:MAG: ACP S-malonyltransferase [Planctomycetes bacterium]|nr:ACP S-malonyltransferase [Planctomycetota bacterium]